MEDPNRKGICEPCRNGDHQNCQGTVPAGEFPFGGTLTCICLHEPDEDNQKPPASES